MPMNIEDADLVNAERDASPTRWQSYDPSEQFVPEIHRVRTEYGEHRRRQSLAASRGATQTGRTGDQEVPFQQDETPTATSIPAGTDREPVEEAEDPAGSREDLESISTASSNSTGILRAELRGRRSRGGRPHYMSTVSTTSTRVEHDLLAYLDRHPTAVARIELHRLQHMQTVGSTKIPASEGVELPDFGGGKPYPPPLPAQDQYVVEFSGFDDPRHAQNFTLKTKLIISSVLVFYSIATTLASSIFSAATEQLENDWHKGREVVTLGTSLFVLGYAVGPSIFGPLSELYGRRPPIIIAAFGFAIFNTAVAVAKDYQTLIISRFFSGLFGSAPLAITGAVFADMFDNKTRGIAMACFSAALFNGPFCGPFLGGFIAKSYLGWRWTAWIPAFMGYAAGVAAMYFQTETYGPVILVGKASELRRMTRNWGIHAKQEEVEVDLRELAVKNVTRPLRILFTEPIVLLITIYMSFIYGLLYLNLTAYALVYEEVYGWELGVAGLPYMALVVGVMIGFLCVIFLNKSYVRKLERNNNIPVPEWRLPLTMVGGIIFAAGLFWFGWGGYKKSTPWIVPTLAGLFLGFGIFTVFVQCLNYIIDAYLMFAASAIAANTIMRSLFGAIFPLFASYMFEGIGINWGMTLLGCVAALFIPMPFLFYSYGRRIRALSKFAPAPDIAQDKRRDEEARAGATAEEERKHRNNVNGGAVPSSSEEEPKTE